MDATTQWNVTNGPMVIGGTWASAAIAPSWQSYLGPLYIYKRALSAAEIMTNYNILKGRFGL